MSGNSGVKGVVTSPDVSFDQILTHLTHVPLALSVDVRYQRWEFFGDGLYMDVGASATLPGLLFTNANIHLQTGLAEGFVGYRVINCDKAALSLFAGARYSYQGGDLSIFNNGDARLVRLRQLLGIRNKLDFLRFDRLGRSRDRRARESEDLEGHIALRGSRCRWI